MISRAPLNARTEDGWVLRGEVLSEGSDQSPVAVLLHAMMVSRKTMDRPRGSGLGSTLASHGLGVVSFDLRGHGESGPSARDGARFTYDDFVLEDIPAIVSTVREVFPDRRVVLVGHSLGAHAAIASAGVFYHPRPNAIVSIAGNIWIPSCESDALRRIRKTAMLGAFLGIAETRGYFDARELRMGTDAIAREYVRQFWKMWRSDRYGSMDGETNYLDELRHLKIPILSIASEGDTLLAHPAAVEQFLSPIGASYKTLRVYTSQTLGAPAPDHMGLVTNSVSKPIWKDIADWIQSICR